MADGPAVGTGQPNVLEAYRELAAQNPRDRYVLHWLLMAYLSQKSYVAGIHEFHRFVKADAHNDQAYMCLAVLYEKGGYHDEAIGSYLRVLELNPDEELVYLFLSTRYLVKGEYDKATKVCLGGIDRFPSAERLHFNLGYAFAQNKEFDKAIEAFQNEISISPQCSEAYFNMDLVKRNKAAAAPQLKT